VQRPKLTVWYNTKCPVCNAGIDWQRNRLVHVVYDRFADLLYAWNRRKGHW
jgi:predicted DCC family thiol-disulfide oxidoreductase YuxK